MAALNQAQINFLRDEIYPYIQNSMTDAMRPEGNPPAPEALSREKHPEWSEFIGSMCVDYEVSATMAAEEQKGMLSDKGSIAVKLVDILYAR